MLFRPFVRSKINPPCQDPFFGTLLSLANPPKFTLTPTPDPPLLVTYLIYQGLADPPSENFTPPIFPHFCHFSLAYQGLTKFLFTPQTPLKNSGTLELYTLQHNPPLL